MGTITTAEVFAGLRYAEGYRWPSGTLTYSIPNSGAFWSPSSYAAGEEPYDPAYGVLTTAQRIAFADAVEAWDRLINLEISEVADNSGSQGQIRIAFTDTVRQLGDDSAAYAYTPPSPGSPGAAFNGDIWVDDEYKPDPGDRGDFLYLTLLHELGHALGLKHPFDGAQLPAEFNNTRFTVMSYDDFQDSGFRSFRMEGSTLFADTFLVQASTPMPLDIIAIQGIYGAASNVELGANTYTFDQNTPFLMTLVDHGGADVLELSAHTRASNMDLTPGAFSSIDLFPIADQIAFWTARFPSFSASFIAGFIDDPTTYTWSNNLAINTDTVIETLRLGSGSDTAVGNSADNGFSGGAGSDRLLGGAGSDTIDGGAAGAPGNYLRGDDGNDSLLGAADFDDANGNMGNDTVSTGAGDDFCVGGKDNDLLFGGAGMDFVYGNLGDDSCNGEDGNDVVRGGQGNDTLAGGAGDDFVSGDRGDDTMTGGLGADLFHSSGDAGVDRVLDFSVAQGDRGLLDPGTTFTVQQVGGDTVIMMSAGQVVLVGVTASSLPPGTIFGA